MKAKLVKNTNGKPRILLILETGEERDLMKNEPDLELVRTCKTLFGDDEEILTDLSYELVVPDNLCGCGEPIPDNQGECDACFACE